jgi:DnaJ-class molecular chaperone
VYSTGTELWLQAAYDTLLDDHMRRAYDRFGVLFPEPVLAQNFLADAGNFVGFYAQVGASGVHLCTTIGLC